MPEPTIPVLQARNAQRAAQQLDGSIEGLGQGWSQDLVGLGTGAAPSSGNPLQGHESYDAQHGVCEHCCLPVPECPIRVVFGVRGRAAAEAQVDELGDLGGDPGHPLHLLLH